MVKNPASRAAKRQGDSALQNAMNNFGEILGITSVQIGILIIIPLLLYFKVVNFEFVYDDLLIKNNVQVLSNISNIQEPFVRDAFFQKPGTTFYRPIQLVTFMFDSMISGSSAWMYHLTNIFLHISSVLSLYVLLRLLKIKKSLSFIASLVFSVHPLLACSVSWISSRGDLLIGLLGLWLFITMIYYGRTGNIVFILLHAVCLLVAVFSKETASLLPILLGIFYFLFLRKDFKPFRILYFIGIWAGTILFFLWLKSQFVHETWVDKEVGLKPLLINLNYFPVLLTRIICPVALPFMPKFDTFSLISGLVLIVPLMYGLYYSFVKGWKLPIFGALWFLILILPPMFYRQTNFDHNLMQLEPRFYLPLMGVSVILAFGMQSLPDGRKLHAILILTGVLVAFGILTVNHCEDYRNPLNFTTVAIQKNPESSAAYTYRGYAYTEMQDYPKAIEDYDKAIAISQYPLAYMNRSWVKGLMGDFSGAEMDLTEFIKRNSSNPMAFLQRAEARRVLEKLDAALQDLACAKKLNPDNPRTYAITGWVYNGQKRFHEAITEFSRAIGFGQNDVWAYQGRAFAYMSLGNFEDVVKDCETIVSLQPNDKDFYVHLGDAAKELRQYDKAMNAYTNAINLDSTFAIGYYGRGLVKEAQHDIPGALNDWEIAVRLGYQPANVLIKKYRALVK